MVLHVRYGNEKYDYVDSRAIHGLIRLRRVRMFYRPSEKRWIDVDLDPVRKASNIDYDGMERRDGSLSGVQPLLWGTTAPTDIVSIQTTTD
jgi:hypothetical protein